MCHTHELPQQMFASAKATIVMVFFSAAQPHDESHEAELIVGYKYRQLHSKA